MHRKTHFKPIAARSLGIILNYRCCNSCRHCLYSSSPEIKESISLTELHDIISSITCAIPDTAVHIGGGEPLLEFNKLVELTDLIRENSLYLEYIETNGHLIHTDDGKRKLMELYRHGVKCLLLSISPFHAEFLTVDRNKKAFANITEVFGTNGIFPWHTGFYEYLDSFDQSKIISFGDFAEKFGPEETLNILNNIIYIHPAGRAAFMFYELGVRYPAESFFGCNCLYECSSPVHAHIDYTGNYFAGFCAGLALGLNQAKDLQSLYSKGLDMQDHPILDLLINRSMKELYDFANAKGFETDLKTPLYSSKCHFCAHIRSFIFHETSDSYKELRPDFFYEDMKKLFNSIKI